MLTVSSNTAHRPQRATPHSKLLLPLVTHGTDLREQIDVSGNYAPIVTLWVSEVKLLMKLVTMLCSCLILVLMLMAGLHMLLCLVYSHHMSQLVNLEFLAVMQQVWWTNS